MSNVNPIPHGLHTVTAALSVDGAADAIEFYKAAFGAEEVQRAPDPSGQKIWHAAIRIGTSQVFVNDLFPEMGGTASKSRLWIYVDNVDALFKRAIAAGATPRVPVSDMFWGDRMGMVIDKWGIEWTLAQHIKDMTPGEQQKAQEDFVTQMKR